MNLNDITKNYDEEDKARKFFEAQRWPEGPECPFCGEINNATELPPIKNGRKKDNGETTYRKGVWKCKAPSCRKQFTVKIGTIFEGSHIPLATWLKAIHLMCASKKGISSHQIHRMLGVTYKSAWFITHRIRLAMKREPLRTKLSGTVEVDETYVGGKTRGLQGDHKTKATVVSLVERGGDVRSFHHQKAVTSKNLKEVIRENVTPDSHVMTDDFGGYHGLKKEFRRHSTIRHKWRVYARKEGDILVSTNTIEGFFATLKRGVNGTFHHIGKQHLHRYLSEFDFRYNARRITDGERTLLAIKGIEGKRLLYRDPVNGEPA